MKLDFLMINPYKDLKKEKERKLIVDVDEKIPRQQSPHLGAGYSMVMSKRDKISFKYIDVSAYEIELETLLKIVKQTHPIIIGFTAFTVQVKLAAYITEEIKKIYPNVLIGLGGPHATALPHETLIEFPVFDFIVCCEGDDVIPKLLNNLNDFSVIPGIVTKKFNIPINHRINDLDSLPFPSWNEFDLTKCPGSDPHRTKLELPMSTSMGCPFSCNFCARMFEKKRNSHSVDYVISEMERNIKDFGAQAFSIMDETFISNISWNEDLFKKMIDRRINKKIKWSCSTRVDIVTPEIFKLMRKSGCYYVFFGFEHGDDDMLKIMGKKVNSEQAKKAVKWAKNADLVVVGCFILGLPGETVKSAYKNIYFAKNLDVYSTAFPIACPYPGTLLKEQALGGEYGLRVLTNDWDDYGKQYPGVMESNVIPIDRLRKLQQEAYTINPKKKNINDYEKLNTYV